MPKIITLLSIFLISACFVLWDSFAPPKGIERTNTFQQNRTPAPDAKFHLLDQTTTSIHTYKGKTIILNFWATWCTPCVIEMPQLLELAKRNQESVVLIALSVDEQPEKISHFIKTQDQDILKQDNVIFGLDTDKTISKALYGTTMYPETYIIDRNLNIKHKIEGLIDWLGPDAQKMISQQR